MEKKQTIKQSVEKIEISYFSEHDINVAKFELGRQLVIGIMSLTHPDNFNTFSKYNRYIH